MLRALAARYRWSWRWNTACGRGPRGFVAINAARRAPTRAEGTPDWMEVGRPGIACSAVLQGRQTVCGGDGRKADPPEGKRSAQAENEEEAGGPNDHSRKIVTWYLARVADQAHRAQDVK